VPASAVPAISYPDSVIGLPHTDDARAWAGRAVDVPAKSFARESWLHGVRHTQRVHIHAQRLVRELHWQDDDAQVVLQAALWHDIGRVNDGWDPQHGALSAKRVADRCLDAALPEADAQIARFAIRYHSRSDGRGERRAIDEAEPERALRVLWLLKDADALDRVRLAPPGQGAYEIDSTTLRHTCTIEMVEFAEELLAVMP